jgi:ADP-ribosylglycohydrolase
MKNKKMKDKVRGAIVGVAIGDALGMPVESLKPKTIKKYFKRIETYKAPNPKTKCFHKLKRGQWTDDTQLTLAIGESIVSKKSIDYEDIADRHVDMFLNGKRGWGKATKKGIQKILNGGNWWDSGGLNEAGNGPPMKIAPIGILYGINIINKIEMITACTNISKMTHGDSRAIVGAILQSMLIGAALRGGVTSLKEEMFHLQVNAEYLEDNFSDECLNKKFNNIIYTSTMPDKTIRDLFGVGPFINESLPFTYTMVYKYINNPNKCLECIVNQGGDSDTTGAIAGSLLGAVHGYSKFPLKWRRGLEERPRLIKLADSLLKLGDF